MKILYLHQYFNTPGSVGGTRSYEMAKRLVAAGHEVQMITSQRREESGHRTGWHKTVEDGIQVHWLPIPYSNHMPYRQRIHAFMKFALKAGPKAAGLGGDIIFATSTPLTIALPAVYAAKKNRLPIVFEVRDLWPEIPIAVGALKNPLTVAAARRLERFAYKNSTRIVALSPGMKKAIAATGYPQDRVAVVPNGCDLDIFDAAGRPGKALREKYDWLRERPLVIYAGTMGAVNGVDYLVRLASQVWQLDREIRFLVVGGGKEEAKVRALAQRLGVIGKNFFILPMVPKREIAGWFSAADIVTSLVIDNQALWMNSANKFFDGLAAGRPIAINYLGWQAELLAQTGAGLVLDAKDIGSAAGALLAAVRDEQWLNTAGTAAGKLGRERFDRDKLAAQIEEILKEAVSEEGTKIKEGENINRPTERPVGSG